MYKTEGIIVFVDSVDSSSRLMYWDVGTDSEGENLEMALLEQNQQVQQLLEPQLYERAAQLSRRLMQKADSFGKTLMLGKIEGRR